ncbi:MAG: hypothetical protein ACP5NI_01385 [Acetobacteraceae bacterium]
MTPPALAPGTWEGFMSKAGRKTTAAAAPVPDAEAVRAALRESGVELDPGNRDDARTIAGVLYLIELARAHPHGITHGSDHKAFRGAVRELLGTLPRMIAEAEAEAEAEGAAAEGRATDMDRFAELARVLLAAAAPFAVTARAIRTKRGWWHPFAVQIAMEIRLVFHRRGLPVGASVSTAPLVRAVVALLGLAGIERTPEAVLKALRRP